jgi:urease accessory protein
MININSIVGNIRDNDKLTLKYQVMTENRLSEIVQISRTEAERVRMRKTSNKGNDVAIALSQNTRLRNGDVLLLTADRMIVVEITPEKVAVVSFKTITDNHLFETAVRIGHTIGNLHRPIRLEDNKIFIPIQADSELDLLRKLFGQAREHVEVSSTNIVFEPEEGTGIHEH